MAQIFIAYSRSDREVVEKLLLLLGQVLPEYTTWIDEHISGGEDWWRRILYEIDSCDLFVYLISNDSLEASYCQAEFREALRLRKTCLPVLVRPQTEVGRIQPELGAEIRRRPGINLSGGFGNSQANARLCAAIRKLVREAPKEYQWPLSPVPVLEPELNEEHKKKSQGKSRPNQMAGVAVIALMVALGMLVIAGLTGLLSPNTPTPPPTAAALLATTQAPIVLPPTKIVTPTPPPPTATPTEIDIDQMVATLHSRATDAQATTYVQATEIALATGAGTLAAPDQTATATRWTVTPTPNITASIEAFSTQWYATATAKALATPLPQEGELQRAERFTGGNLDWEPFVYLFATDPAEAEMVLVPPGRFMMGSQAGNGNEQPVNAQAIAAAFWIDRTEVTRAQYARCVAAGACTEEPPANPYSMRDAQPVNRVTWFAALTYCNWRGMRLPTEVEWEYAARGPDDWRYPWGDAWNTRAAVYADNSSGVTADVDSHPAGASWVGAVDLVGNVWEWTSSLYGEYPYEATHEDDLTSHELRVIRGGSFDYSASALRATLRDGLDPGGEDSTFGFRCARPASD